MTLIDTALFVLTPSLLHCTAFNGFQSVFMYTVSGETHQWAQAESAHTCPSYCWVSLWSSKSFFPGPGSSPWGPGLEHLRNADTQTALGLFIRTCILSKPQVTYMPSQVWEALVFQDTLSFSSRSIFPPFLSHLFHFFCLFLTTCKRYEFWSWFWHVWTWDTWFFVFALSFIWQAPTATQ